MKSVFVQGRTLDVTTVFYQAPNKKAYVQLGTPGKNGWLLTNGPQADLPKLQTQHRELVELAFKPA